MRLITVVRWVEHGPSRVPLRWLCSAVQLFQSICSVLGIANSFLSPAAVILTLQVLGSTSLSV
jgi:hypothetical protein